MRVKIHIFGHSNYGANDTCPRINLLDPYRDHIFACFGRENKKGPIKKKEK